MAGCYVAVLTVVLCMMNVVIHPRFALLPSWHYSIALTYQPYQIGAKQCWGLEILTRNDEAALSPCTVRSPSSLPSPASSDIRGTHGQAVEDARAAQQAAADKQLYQRADDWLTSADHRREEKYSLFLPLLTLAERGRLLSTWRTLHLAFAQHGIPYFLVSGSLLGAIRHRGLIPWDDDIDVAVNVNYTDDIQRVLSCVPGYTLRVAPNMHWKFFVTDSPALNGWATADRRHARNLTNSGKMSFVREKEYQNASNVVVRYPFVDIFIMASSRSCTRAFTNYLSSTVTFRTEDLYPLRLVPFEGYMAPVPRRAHHILNMRHDVSVCRFKSGHNQIVQRTWEVACQELTGMYPMYTL